MMRSMFAGVSGLRNHQIRMDVIGNNIANVNTIGFKSSRVSFQDTLNQMLRGASAPQGERGGINPLQVGLGVNIATIDVIHTQGNLQNTGKISDVAIQGDGFFILSDGGNQYYTRAGNFNMERDGRLVNPSNGLVVQGWMADDLGNINPNSPLTNIRLPIGQTINPVATSVIEFGGNLNSQTLGELTYSEMTLTDENGNSVRVAYNLIPTSNYNEFQYTTVVTNGSIVSGTGSGIIRLNLDGTVAAIYGSSFEVQSGAANALPITINPPQIGQASGGIFSVAKNSAEDLTLGAAFSGAGTYPTSVRDEQGNLITFDYEVTSLGGDDYAWNIVNVSGGTLASGSGGTFTWDGTTFSGSSGSIVLTSAAGYDVTLGPRAADQPPYQVINREGINSFVGSFDVPKPIVNTTKVYDSLGNSHILVTTVTKTDVNNWSWVTTDAANNVIGSGVLTFASNGNLIAAPGSTISFTPTGAEPIVITPDFSKVTQFASNTSEINSPFQNGYPMGQLQSFNIDKSGQIIGVFSNGMNKTLAQMAIANFTNPAGLIRSGDTLFEVSGNSGPPQIGQAGQNGRGLVTPGAVEMSNVDLSQEFTDMIVTQRGFQSNSRIITTSDEMLQELVNLKR